MAMIVLRSPFDLVERQPHFFCRRRPMQMVHRCHKKSPICKGHQNEVAKKESDNFEVQLDVKGFTPEEISVKMVGREVVVEAKSEKKTENSFESQHFVRKFNIPEGYNVENVISSINKDGLMTVTAPRPITEEGPKERAVPIQFTLKPARTTPQPENKDDGSIASTSKE